MIVRAGSELARARVLIVDDEVTIRRSALAWLERDGYRCQAVESGEEAVQWLAQKPYDAVITDIHMLGLSGMELLKAIKQGDPDTQVIVMTGNPSVDFAVQAIRLSADDYLVKPFRLSQLTQAVRRVLVHRALLLEKRAYRERLEEKVREQAQNIERLFRDSLAALAAAVDARDHYTGDHLDRVTRYALSTGHQLRLDEQQMWTLWLASLLHDVGKLAIPDSILNKQGPLSDEEYAVMKQHPALGVRVVQNISFLRPAIPGILHHQERWDGTGYPAGLMGEEIPIEGRILAVSDAFDAMLTDRPYRKARTDEEAVVELSRCSGTQFDPKVLEAFLAARQEGFPVTLPSTSPVAMIQSGSPAASWEPANAPPPLRRAVFSG